MGLALCTYILRYDRLAGFVRGICPKQGIGLICSDISALTVVPVTTRNRENAISCVSGETRKGLVCGKVIVVVTITI